MKPIKDIDSMDVLTYGMVDVVGIETDDGRSSIFFAAIVLLQEIILHTLWI